MSESKFMHRSDLIDGYIISRPGLSELAVAETTFAIRHLHKVTQGLTDMPIEQAKPLLIAAEDRMATGYFNNGRPGWVPSCLAADGPPLMLYLSLRIKHPDMTQEKSNELYAKTQADGTDKALTIGLLELWGLLTALDRPEDPNPGAPKAITPAPVIDPIVEDVLEMEKEEA